MPEYSFSQLGKFEECALRGVAPRREAERDPELMRISSLQKASV